MIHSYKDVSVCVIGQYGFIGSALVKKLKSLGAKITKSPVKDNRIIFNLSGPTHLQFEENPGFYLKETISTFMNLMDFCQENNITYVWPSSALVYENDKHSPFIYTKKAIEELQRVYKANTIGLRIFPVYGVGEENKGRFKTIIYQWCEQIINGESPVVYGDGTQKRDFVYIDDVVDHILGFGRLETSGMADIGAGAPESFNDIIGYINEACGTNIQPTYVAQPNEYSRGIVCQSPLPMKVTMREGIKKIMEDLKWRKSQPAL